MHSVESRETPPGTVPETLARVTLLSCLQFAPHDLEHPKTILPAQGLYPEVQAGSGGLQGP